MSESQNNVVSIQDNDKKQEKKGLKLAGYIVPWWVVLVVFLVLLYLAYDNNMLDFVCNPKKELTLLPQSKGVGIPLPSFMPQTEMAQAVQVPPNLKNLFA